RQRLLERPRRSRFAIASLLRHRKGLSMFKQLVIAALVLLGLASTDVRAEDPKDLVFIFQKQKDPARIQSDADKVAAYLSKEVGLPVKAVVPGDYSASVQALVGKKADFAYVSAIPFLLARRDGGAT